MNKNLKSPICTWGECEFERGYPANSKDNYVKQSSKTTLLTKDECIEKCPNDLNTWKGAIWGGKDIIKNCYCLNSDAEDNYDTLTSPTDSDYETCFWIKSNLFYLE